MESCPLTSVFPLVCISYRQIAPYVTNWRKSLEHLFLFCPITMSVWATAGFTTPPPPPNYIFKDWLLDGIFSLTSSPSNKDRFFLFIATLWAIWKTRNQEVFSSIPFLTSSIIGLAVDNALRFKHSSHWNSRTKPPPSNTSHQGAHPSFVLKPYPPVILFDQRVVHITVDGAWKEGALRSGLGLYASYPNGTVVQQCSISCCSSTPLQTEIMAILLAITWALHHNFNCLIALM